MASARVALAGAARRWQDAIDGRRVVADPLAHGDVVLARKDAPASYHLAVTVDDAAQGVTDVVRGARPVRARPMSTGCCRRCSACRRRATTTIRC